MAVPTAITDLSATIASNVPAGTDQAFPYVDDYLRAAYGFIRQGDTKAADVASAATVDLGAVVGRFVDVTGTTTITSFGTVAAGIWRIVTFAGALTLTHNATSLILPGAANITTAAGDSLVAESLGSGNWRVLFYQRGSALQDASFRNKIINGNFDIWQRGTSSSAVGPYVTSDRWAQQVNGSTRTTSRQSFALGQTDVPGNPRYFNRTVVTSSAGAANYSNQMQAIESVSTLAGKTATLSFYAKADASRSIAVEFYQYFGSGGSPSSSVSGIGAQKLSLTTSWQKFTVTVSVPSISGKTLGTDGKDYLGVLFWFDAGSNYNSRAATLGQQSGTFDIANVQVEEGSVATPFEQRPLGLELSLCQRYYARTTGFIISGYGGAPTASLYEQWNSPVEMRAAPVLAVSNPNYSNASGAAPAGTGDRQSHRFTCSATAAGQAWAVFDPTADAEL